MIEIIVPDRIFYSVRGVFVLHKDSSLSVLSVVLS